VLYFLIADTALQFIVHFKIRFYAFYVLVYLLKNNASENVFTDDDVTDKWTTPMFTGESYLLFTEPTVIARCVCLINK